MNKARVQISNAKFRQQKPYSYTINKARANFINASDTYTRVYVYKIRAVQFNTMTSLMNLFTLVCASRE